MDPRDDSSVQAWATLRAYQDPARYLAPLDAGPPLLRAAPAATRRSPSGDPDADDVRAYLRHSCDLTLRGGAAAAVAYPLAACALAEHYLVRRVGGSGAAAAVAAAVAAAEVGRTVGQGTDDEPDDGAGAADPRGTDAAGTDTASTDTHGTPPVGTRPGGVGSRLVLPGYAGLAQAAGWLAGDERTGDPAAHRLTRLLQPSRRMRPAFRLLCALLGPAGTRGGSRRGVAVLAALAGAPSRGGRVAVALVWTGVVLGWIGLTVALLRSPTVEPWVVLVATPPLLATVVLAGLAATVLAGVHGLREALAVDGPREQFGLVPGVPVVDPAPPPGRASRALDRLAGVPEPGGLPPLTTWLAEVLDDLAGLPSGPGLLADAGLTATGAEGRALTFGDLWLGRTQRREGDAELLRRADADPEQRVVDLRLLATDVTRGRPVRVPLGPGWLFCPDCLLAAIPARAVAQLEAAGRADPRHPCPAHGTPLRPLPAAADVPVVLGVRLAVAPAGLLRLVPLYRPGPGWAPDVRDPFGETAPGAGAAPDDPGTTTHWFCEAGADADVAMFDTVLPRWPTVGLAVLGGVDAPDDGAGAWVDVAASSARSRPAPVRSVAGAGDLIAAVLGGPAGAADRVALGRQGDRGRLGAVRRGRGAAVGPFLDADEVLRLALRGHRAGLELRDVLTGRDGEVDTQTGTDRHRWLRMRTALREHRDLSLLVAARLPLYGDLAASYRVPADVAGWFTPPVTPGRVDPAWADAAAALTHLRALTTDGVLDWDTDYGAPPREDG